MKIKFLLTVISLALLFMGCEKTYRSDNDETITLKSSSVNRNEHNGHIKIAVLSDIHYMHPSLLQNDAANGTAFRSTFLSEPYKVLLEYSPAILNEVISELLAEHPDIVLVAGDMAKDGEKICHESVAASFSQLQQNGIKVFVIPGNNDINNPTAFGYNGNSSYVVPNVSPTEFKSIYSQFGYSSAIASDPNSLSYVAEIAPGLRIIAIDAVRYTPIYHRSGTIKPQTMEWVKQQMMLANQNGITVFGLMHHNLVEHFSWQTRLTPYTLIGDLSASSSADDLNWQSVADSFMAWNLKVIFTGHSHVNDISRRITGANTLYDIATGSLVTPPSPYRIMVLKNKELDISTSTVRSIDMPLPKHQSFVEYSDQVLSSSLDNYFTIALSAGKFLLKDPVLSYSVPLARNAFKAYVAGDENISPLEQAKIDSLNLVIPVPTYTIGAINSLWTDMGVKDNKWHIKLTDL